MYHTFIKVDQGHHVPYIYLFGVLDSKACLKHKDSWHRWPEKTLDATCSDFDRNVINAGMTIWNHLCMLMVDTLNTCS